MIYNGIAAIHLQGCSFDACNWTLDGPAARTVQALADLYKHGGGPAELVRNTFNNILNTKA